MSRATNYLEHIGLGMVFDERLGELRSAINAQTGVLAARMGTDHERTLP